MNHAFSLYVGNPNPRFEMVFYDQRGVEGELASLSSWIHDTEAGGYVLIAVEYVSPQANLVETRKRVSELGHEYMIMLNEGCYQPSHYTWLVTPRIY